MKDIRVIAHRGAGGPENSPAAFARAIELGVHAIEIDVRATLDGHAVLMHDESVDRTTNGRGKVSNMTLEEVRALKLRNGEPVPTLEDTLRLLNERCPLILELKDAGAAAAAGSAVSRMKLMRETVFSSFHGPWLVDIKLRFPDARVAFISDNRKMDCVRIAASLKASSLHMSGRMATRKLILKAHEAGLDANIWTVNSPRKLRNFIAMGADGIITDRPEALAKALGEIRALESGP